ncbi:hypothetical protein [Streptomyces sp. NRRL B-24572]|uniref:hypothetical protein n=1 Tax=Streptomyces sp. NRRL B-24572 TaxID=1962156 RepID=UPI000A36B6C9|nr:hypothetical protein [Streptomyces sp. NRRL B-24572]
MSVSLDKTPYAFTVFLVDGAPFGVALTPQDDDERDAMYLEAHFGLCLDVYEVTAIDRYEAFSKGVEAHTRLMATNEAIERAEA